MVKNPTVNSGDVGSIPGSGRSLGEENGNPLQYSCLESPMDREAWQLQSMALQKKGTQLSDSTITPGLIKIFKDMAWGNNTFGSVAPAHLFQLK